jgi:enterochelin esterase-like enzyme
MHASPPSRPSIAHRLRLFFAAAAALASLFIANAAYAAVDTVTIFSPSNNRNLTFRVYTPPGYATNSTQSYPLVISLHGIGGNPQQRANTYVSTLDTRINSGELLPMIWLFPDGQNNSFYGDAFDGHKQAYSHIIGEALPYVDANYRTIPDRDHRAMEGFSMGGFGASMYTAKHPELFSAVVEQGGALSKWTDLVNADHGVAVEMYNLVEANFRPYSLWDLTTANADLIRTGINYKMIVGDADFTETSNERFRDHLVSLGIDPHYQVLPGVEHLGGQYVAEGSGLRFLSDHFASVFRGEGDYDRDGDADTADYAAWTRNFGTPQPAADGNHDNSVDAADYVLWRKLNNPPTGAGGNAPAATSVTLSAAIPEPAGSTGVVISILVLIVAYHPLRLY